MTGRAPVPLALLGIGGAVCITATSHPALVGAGLIGALALVLSAPRRMSRLAIWSLLLAAAGLLVLTPWVSANGQTILFQGPPLAVIDTTVSLEEVIWGSVIAGRLAAVVLIVAGVLAWMDEDRAQEVLARVLPRSALMIGLAGRMLPTLERDAHTVAQSARLRGVDLDSGSPLVRARSVAPLILPVAASALERGVDSAEALVARGFGSGPPTRLPEPALNVGEWIVGGCGALLLTMAIPVSLGLVGDFGFFPGPDGSADTASLGAAALIGIALMIPAGALRR